MAKWYVHKNGKQHGPFDSSQLNQLAQSSKIGPDDLVRRDDMQSWTKASTVKGLFEKATQAVPPQISPTTAPSPSQGAVRSVASIGTPAGKPSGGGIRRYSLILGFAALVVIGLIGRFSHLRQLKSTYDEATRLWDAGKKKEASALYHTLKDRSELGDEKRQVLFQRLVDDALANDSTDAARQLLQQAVEDGVIVVPSTIDGQKLLSAVRAEADELKRRKELSELYRRGPEPPKNVTAEKMLKNLERTLEPLDASNFASLEVAINRHNAEAVAETLRRFGPYSLFSQKEIDAMKHPVGGWISPSNGTCEDMVDHKKYVLPSPVVYWDQSGHGGVATTYGGCFYRRKLVLFSDREEENEYVKYKYLSYKNTNTTADSVGIEKITFVSPDATETSMIVESGAIVKVRCVTPGEDRVDLIPRLRRVFDAKANDYRQEEYLDRVTFTSSEKKIYRIILEAGRNPTIERGDWEGY